MNFRSILKPLCVLPLSAALILAGCNGSGASSSASSSTSDSASIALLTREDGSGTRSAFVELFGLEQKQEDGTKIDTTTPNAAVTNSTSVMLTTVASNPDAIGYVSLGSLNDTVKAASIDGAEASAENVKNDTYKISRPFLVVSKGTLSEPAQDFLNFILSDEGQKVVTDNGYIALESPAAYTPAGASGKVVVSGSSSVTPVMEKLSEAYSAKNPDVTVEIQQSDSSSGITDAADGISDLGMSSRELKDSELELGLTSTQIATDGIAVIVNKENSVGSLTSETVQKIYSGQLTSWDEIDS